MGLAILIAGKLMLLVIALGLILIPVAAGLVLGKLFHWRFESSFSYETPRETQERDESQTAEGAGQLTGRARK